MKKPKPKPRPKPYRFIAITLTLMLVIGGCAAMAQPSPEISTLQVKVDKAAADVIAAHRAYEAGTIGKEELKTAIDNAYGIKESYDAAVAADPDVDWGTVGIAYAVTRAPHILATVAPFIPGPIGLALQGLAALLSAGSSTMTRKKLDSPESTV